MLSDLELLLVPVERIHQRTKTLETPVQRFHQLGVEAPVFLRACQPLRCKS